MWAVRQLESWLQRYRAFLVGTGGIQPITGGARLVLASASSRQYSDAQLDDYAGLRRRRYPHQPPSRFSLRARFSHEAHHHTSHVAHHFLTGTAGFGFWNNPFGAQSKVPALPQAIWFFYASPPSNMALALDVSGYGWKAACIDAGRASAIACAPIAPPVILACRSTRLYRAIWPRIQRALAISEVPLPPQMNMTDWHIYDLEWRRDGAQWKVDGQTLLETDRAPRGPLGFVAWIDNQYAIVRPQGGFGFGLLDIMNEQWVEISEVDMTNAG